MPPVRGGNLFGPGGLKRLPAIHDFGSLHRRVIAHFGYRPATAAAATARAQYLTRDGAGRTDDPETDRLIDERVAYLDRDRSGGGFFDANRDGVPRAEVAKDLARGKRIYSLVLNPLEGDHRRYNPRRLTRDTMRAVERDLGFKPGQLRWYAAVHKARRFDRERTRHVHVVWSSRRIDDARFQMLIARAYVKHGFALRASQAMHAQLGPMKDYELERMRESLAANRERTTQLKAMPRNTPEQIGKIRAAGREWVRDALDRQMPHEVTVTRNELWQQVRMLRDAIDEKFGEYRTLQAQEKQLKATMRERLNPVSRWFNDRQTTKLDQIKVLMDRNRDASEELAANPKARFRHHKAATLKAEHKLLRREYGRVASKISARMTPNEHYQLKVLRGVKREQMDEIKELRAERDEKLEQLGRGKEHRERMQQANTERREERYRGMVAERNRVLEMGMERSR